jgi:hypothetical protein
MSIGLRGREATSFFGFFAVFGARGCAGSSCGTAAPRDREKLGWGWPSTRITYLRAVGRTAEQGYFEKLRDRSLERFGGTLRSQNHLQKTLAAVRANIYSLEMNFTQKQSSPVNDNYSFPSRFNRR